MAKFYNKGPAIFQSPVEKTAAEAWTNATETAKTTKKELVDEGWCAQQLIITGKSR